MNGEVNGEDMEETAKNRMSVLYNLINHVRKPNFDEEDLTEGYIKFMLYCHSWHSLCLEDSYKNFWKKSRHNDSTKEFKRLFEYIQTKHCRCTY